MIYTMNRYYTRPIDVKYTNRHTNNNEKSFLKHIKYYVGSSYFVFRVIEIHINHNYLKTTVQQF